MMMKEVRENECGNRRGEREKRDGFTREEVHHKVIRNLNFILHLHVPRRWLLDAPFVFPSFFFPYVRMRRDSLPFVPYFTLAQAGRAPNGRAYAPGPRARPPAPRCAAAHPLPAAN
eukprot:scaffold3641_cov32-Tisochrysis_lutea.AAC.4